MVRAGPYKQDCLYGLVFLYRSVYFCRVKEPGHNTKAARTRNHIIEHTAELFNKKGYAGTSMTDLTAATGLTKGSIYGNFKNKDEVAVAVFHYNLSCLNHAVQHQVHQCADPVEKLLAYPRFYRAHYKQQFAKGGCPILNTAIEADDCHQALRQAVNQAIAQWASQLEGIVKQGQSMGRLQPGANGQELASLIITLIEGAMMLAKTTGHDYYMVHATNHLEGLIQGLAINNTVG